ncbi:hypothetical protein Dvina_22790 [Dactylosporangium vinaceum]|uniref:Uncharacterized protein n=1 Tax=Dactylosporangium vinaceum TaxID=53362 RepID=A0ABV5MSF8_9ACTN|nr:hypothetical protein [Dactylosporangium vinaceum]UAC00628.1 hypothetical protein Dvina_22790 [Dactylosporangium vinaceum]
MTDLETRIADVLADRAAKASAPGGLAERATRRGKRIRRRRLVVGTAAIVALLVLVPFTGRSTGTTLPAAPGGADAAIGSDRGLLHFDVDLGRLPSTLTDRITVTEWVSGDGYERFVGQDDERKPIVTIWLTGSAARADDFNSMANGGSTRNLRWQRGGVEGLTVLGSADRDLLPKVADAVRLGATQRCVMPIHLSELPAGGRWTECQTAIRRSPGAASLWVYSGLTLRRADDRTVFIWADSDQGATAGPSAFAADREVAGRPAMWRSGSGAFANGLWITDFAGIDLYVSNYESGPADWFTPDEAGWYATRLTPSPDLNDPATWPRRAVG